ncbi:hypothetical protein Q765_03195 [Flavobacterium rivuli WB 3.3-2 = DSM 21788]|uniref:Uncharacterized protein n=1 Tax=Flavobacterium rivuli WB 3.3-2 = DSM 21788 TaxID=1121895 RepID=A0A0A2M8V6_9FLAO|nr:hypothetical protein [Flavobacterium rivuli]KGO88076.1 hypothetical protein Q765_03195 [Flavobacterium rivuli WB 3.3-2 = DSM 21788]
MENVETKAVTFSDMQIACQKATATLAKLQEVLKVKYTDDELETYMNAGPLAFLELCFEKAIGRKPLEYETAPHTTSQEPFTDWHLKLLIIKNCITEEDYNFIYEGLNNIFHINDFDVQVKDGYVIIHQSEHDVTIEKLLKIDHTEQLGIDPFFKN